MNILFLFSSYPEDKDTTNLHKDLPDEFSHRGESVYVATIRERRLGLDTAVSDEYGKKVLRVRTGNIISSTSRLEKGLAMLCMDRSILAEIKRYWGAVEFDLIIGSTPYTAGHRLIVGLKDHFKCRSFLILWDLFPQNAKDLGIIKNNFVFNFFKRRENRNLKAFDYIGCTTEGNINYVIKKYTFIDIDKLCLFPLWGNRVKNENTMAINRLDYGFQKNDFILVFGGNMGKPQNLSNVINLANELRETNAIKFLFIGSGTEVDSIRKQIKEMDLANVKFFPSMPREQYQGLIAACDVGIVSLHPSFTIPNFPSKTVDYLECGLPILAALDDTALQDYGEFIEGKVKVGLCCHADDMVSYKENLLKLYKDKDLYDQLSINCREIYDADFNIKNNYSRIMEIL